MFSPIIRCYSFTTNDEDILLSFLTNGNKGDRGFQGFTGFQLRFTGFRVTGFRGFQGYTGSRFQGKTGFQGYTGFQGHTGTQVLDLGNAWC